MSVDTPREGLDPDGLIAESIVDEAALQARIREMGAQIAVDYAGKDLLLVGVLKGAVLFMSDLIRAIPMPCEVDFMAISSLRLGHRELRHRAHPQGPGRLDRGPRRADRRGHHRLGPDALVPRCAACARAAPPASRSARC